MDNLTAVRGERAAAEERRTLLLREMNHRIKNILAAVQAIANQTFKGEATAASMQVFGSRLAAMAAAHDLLVTRHWESAELAAHSRPRSPPSVSTGPAASPSKARRSALPPGRRWRSPWRCTSSAPTPPNTARSPRRTATSRSAGASPPRIRPRAARAVPVELDRERRPAGARAGARGFGTRMIETALAGELAARTELAFPPDGLRFILDADAAALVAEAAGPEAGTAA